MFYILNDSSLGNESIFIRNSAGSIKHTLAANKAVIVLLDSNLVLPQGIWKFIEFTTDFEPYAGP